MSPSWDAIADNLIRELGLNPRPPVDVEELARSLGVSQIEERPLVEDGRLESSSDGRLIVIRQGSTPARRRFTIAHELAHLLLTEANTEATFRRSSETDDVERLCDSLAAAILMPRNWMLGFANRAHNLSTMRSVSHHADVSYSAAVARLRSVLRWNEGLLRFEHHEGRWRFTAGSGVPAILFGRVRSSPSTSDALEATRRMTSRDIVVSLPIRVDDSDVELDAQVSIGRRRAFALADLNRLAALVDRRD